MISPDPSSAPGTPDTPPASPKAEARTKPAAKGKPRVFYRDPLTGEQTEGKPDKKK
jgi:hypothetical protein